MPEGKTEGCATPAFKVCSCGFSWEERADFLSEPLLQLVGYQVHFEHLELGLFLFNHASCGTTLSVRSGDFLDLLSGSPVYSHRLSGTDDCPEYCLRKEDLRPCLERCECAFVRDVMQVILGWPKHGALSSSSGS